MSAKDQYWFKIDTPYLLIVNGIYMLKEIKHLKEKSSEGRFTFEIDIAGLQGITFQLTSGNKLGVYLARGESIEDVVGLLNPFLDKAAGEPVRISLPYFANRPIEPLSKTHVIYIASGLLALVRLGRYSVENEFGPRPENLKFALEHLKTGYLDIYCILKELYSFTLDARKDPNNKDIIEGVKDARKKLMDNVEILVEKLRQETEPLNIKSKCELCGWKPSKDEKKEIEDLVKLFYVGRMY